MLRVLLIADTHLGFDLPLRPRSDRPRRGKDFFANLDRALEPAHRGEVDLVVHGGDLLYRSKVPPRLVAMALEPLLAVADRGLPVLLVPGNHERSSLPYPLLAAHRCLHLFDRPRTVRLALGGFDVAVAGFPCERDRVAEVFSERITACAAPDGVDIRLLCLHQAVEGARVGPVGYTFRRGPDIVPGRLLPPGFAAVLAGHIHRHQVLDHDLRGRPLACPVIYPGAIERTSSAECNEPKGYVLLDIEPDRSRGGRMATWRFVELPAPPMLRLDLDPQGLSRVNLAERITTLLAVQPANAVVTLRLAAPPDPGAAEVLRVATLRRLHPPDMIVTVRWSFGYNNPLDVEFDQQ